MDSTTRNPQNLTPPGPTSTQVEAALAKLIDTARKNNLNRK